MPQFLTIKRFDKLCKEAGFFDREEFLKFCKDHRIENFDAVELSVRVAKETGVELTLDKAGKLFDSISEYCDSCFEKYTKKDIDGGRCLSCGAMIA